MKSDGTMSRGFPRCTTCVSKTCSFKETYGRRITAGCVNGQSKAKDK